MVLAAKFTVEYIKRGVKAFSGFRDLAIFYLGILGFANSYLGILGFVSFLFGILGFEIGWDLGFAHF